MPHRTKGDPIRVIGGTYAGHKGWKHAKLGEKDNQIYLILQKVKEGGRVVLPEKTVRIDKKHYMPFVEAITPIQFVLEQKPKLQAKMTDLIKELVKLQVKPAEDFLVVFGHQWVTMYEREKVKIGVDYTRRDEVPQASDDEDEPSEID